MLKITTTITSSKDGIDMITRPNLRADQISRTFMEKMCYICIDPFMNNNMKTIDLLF